MARTLNTINNRFTVNDIVDGVRILDLLDGTIRWISMWINPISLSSFNMYFEALDATGAIGWMFTLDSSGTFLILSNANASNLAPSIGTWQNIQVAHDTTAPIFTINTHYYLDYDGITGKDSIIASSKSTSSERDKSIGGTDIGFSAHAHMAEIAIYDRMPTDQQVIDMAAGKSASFYPDGMLCYFKMDETNGPIVDSGPFELIATEVGNPIASVAHPPIIYPSTGPMTTILSSSSQQYNKFILGGNKIRTVVDTNNFTHKTVVTFSNNFSTISTDTLPIGGINITLFENNSGQMALGVYLIDSNTTLFNVNSLSISDKIYMERGIPFSVIKDGSGNNFWNICSGGPDNGIRPNDNIVVKRNITWNGIPLSLGIDDSIMCKLVSGNITKTERASIGGMPMTFVQVGGRWYIAASDKGCF